MFDKSKLWATGLLVAAFAAGVAAGVAGGAWGGRHPGDGRGRPRQATSYLDRLNHDLQLNPAQKDSVSAILKRYDEPMRELWRRGRQQLDSMRLRVRTEIEAVLNAEQRDRYHVMNQRMDSLRAARERGGATREDR
jgi:Spy/CpxP family protein refolding chaperone